MTNPHLPAPSPTIDPAVIENVLIRGDLSVLRPEQKLQYLNAVCDSVGLNPLTRPFDYLELNGKLVLYATKACTDQLRSIHKISVNIVQREKHGDVYVVTARAKNAEGREDESTGAVALIKEDFEWVTSGSGKKYKKMKGTFTPMTPDEMANAMMKAETKAKRRVTLSICGLGLLDESEVDAIPAVSKPSEAPRAVAPMPALPIGDGPGHVYRTDPAGDPKAIPVAEIIAPTGERDPGERLIEYGQKYKGRKFKEFKAEQIQGYVDWMRNEGKDKSPTAQKFIENAEDYLGSLEFTDPTPAPQKEDDLSDIPF